MLCVEAKAKRIAIQKEMQIAQQEMASLEAGTRIGTKREARQILKSAGGRLQQIVPEMAVKGLSQRQISGLLSNAKRNRGVITKLTGETKTQYITALEEMSAATARNAGKQAVAVKTAEQRKRIEFLKTEQKFLDSEEKRMKRSGAINKAISAGFQAMMIASIAVMGLDLFKSGMRRMFLGKDGLENLNKELRGIDEGIRRLDQINSQLENMQEQSQFVVSAFTQLSNALRAIKMDQDVFRILNMDLEAMAKATEFQAAKQHSRAIPPAALFSTLGLTDLIFSTFFDPTGEVEKGEKLLEERRKFFLQLENLKKLAGTDAISDAIDEIKAAIGAGDEVAARKAVDTFNKLREEYNKLTASAAGFSQAQKTLNQSITNFVNKFAPANVGASMRTALIPSQQATRDALTILEKDFAKEDTKGFSLMDLLDFEVGGKLGDFKKRLEIIKDQEALNKSIDTILGNHIDKQNEINESNRKAVKLKGELVKDGTLEAAQNRVNLATLEKKNKIDELNLNISIMEQLIKDDEIQKNKDLLYILEQAKKMAEAKRDAAESELETQKNLYDIEAQRRKNIQVRRGASAGLTKFNTNIKAAMLDPDNIARVMDMVDEEGNKLFGTESAAVQHIKETELAIARLTIGADLAVGVATRLGSALTDGLGNALLSVVDGTKSLKEAFGEMAKSILADLFKMTFRALIFNALLPGNMLGGLDFGGIGGSRYGGIMSPSGKSFRYGGMVAGGIASGPESGYTATLHGTEAVVPLGNDRTIPVKFSATGAAGTSNVTINVNMETGETTSTAEEDGKQLGIAISAAVQKELEIQRRPGGALRM